MHIASATTIMSTTNSLSSSSFRLFTSKFPLSFFNKNTSPFVITPKNILFSFKPITFQTLPTKPLPSSSSSSTSLQPIEELPPKLQEIVNLFQSVQEPKSKYEQLLFYGKNLKPLEPQFKTKDNKVEGCVSQVWVRAYLDSDKNVVYEADSDSVLTKGLAALLVQGFSGRPVNEIIRVTPDFVVLLGKKHFCFMLKMRKRVLLNLTQLEILILKMIALLRIRVTLL
ncbi:sufE-like protein 1, chloroplastic/mitochondrial [Cicer arietinum]|uniref:sufE-like protein 1, chloroplastic/mitochondrial n=1 Tax=Cicer arietinum TaxID=3827 RepID=UPI003CC5D3FA